eukprot:5561678-Prymnesium_polylepis.1
MTYANGQCNTEKDSEGGTYLWGQDHDGSTSTAFACAGDDPQRATRYDPFAYDAVFAIAHALHELIEVRRVKHIAGSELLDVLLTQVQFDGVTGPIDFHSSTNGSAFNGDRRDGASYAVLNFAQELMTVGTWESCAGVGECNWLQQWWPIPNVGLTFSTADGSRPSQSGSCPYLGQILSHTGACVCDNGYELDPKGEQCRRCEVNQDSRAATANESSSEGCTLCADDFYR